MQGPIPEKCNSPGLQTRHKQKEGTEAKTQNRSKGKNWKVAKEQSSISNQTANSDACPNEKRKKNRSKGDRDSSLPKTHPIHPRRSKQYPYPQFPPYPDANQHGTRNRTSSREEGCVARCPFSPAEGSAGQKCREASGTPLLF